MDFKYLTEKLIGNPNEFCLSHRFLNIILLSGIAICIYASVSNWIFGFFHMSFLIPLVFCFIFSIFYYISIKKKYYRFILYTSLALTTSVLIPTLWLSNNGSFGSMPIYSLLYVVILGIALNREQQLIKIIFLLHLALVIAIAFYIELNFPNILHFNDTIINRYYDFIFDFSFSMIVIYIVISFVIKHYHESNEAIHKMHNELKASMEKLDYLSKTDELTGLDNRRYIVNKLDNTFAKKNSPTGTISSIILIDIDHFKYINDTYGHLYGDHVLKIVSKTIASNIRKSDAVGRFGGEEFLILLPDTQLENAYLIAEELRNIISNLEWKYTDLKVTISGGVAITTDKKSIEELLRDADIYLYEAKRSGRNNIQCGKII